MHARFRIVITGPQLRGTGGTLIFVGAGRRDRGPRQIDIHFMILYL